MNAMALGRATHSSRKIDGVPMPSPKNERLTGSPRSEFRAAFYVDRKTADRNKLSAAEKRANELAARKRRRGGLSNFLTMILFAIIVMGGIGVIISLRDISALFGIRWHE